MAQKYLGTAIGFPEQSADVRLAQYETGSRKAKADLTAVLAQMLDAPDIDSYIGLMVSYALNGSQSAAVPHIARIRNLEPKEEKSPFFCFLFRILLSPSQSVEER